MVAPLWLTIISMIIAVIIISLNIILIRDTIQLS
jgi:Mn2+/Fe2+ NRAMP family transporter